MSNWINLDHHFGDPFMVLQISASGMLTRQLWHDIAAISGKECASMRH